MKIEYKVRPVTRYIVTRYHSEVIENSQTISRAHGGCDTKGEFDNYDTAYAVAYALAKAEQEALGLSPFDETVMFPESLTPDEVK